MGFTEYQGELIKYMTPEHLLIINGNTLFVSLINGKAEDDKVICIIDNFTEKQFAEYVSKTINGYVKRYRNESRQIKNRS